MVRKTIGAAVIGILLVALIFGRNAWSYVKTTVSGMSEAVQSNVPIDFEIRRARTMLADLTPEIRKNMTAIAREEAAIAQLDREIASHDQKRLKDAGEIARLRDDLASGRKTFQYAGKSYTADAVKTDLTQRFERRKKADETLTDLQKTRALREQSLTAARDKMNAMLAAKRQLELDIEQLDARCKMVEAAQATSHLCLDDGQLSRTMQVVSDVRSRLDVEERLVSAELKPLDEIALDEPSNEDIVEQVTAYLSDGERQVAAADSPSTTD